MNVSLNINEVINFKYTFISSLTDADFQMTNFWLAENVQIQIKKWKVHSSLISPHISSDCQSVIDERCRKDRSVSRSVDIFNNLGRQQYLLPSSEQFLLSNFF